MARGLNQKLKLLYLWDYLLENTDKTHTVKLTDIMNHLQTEHNVDVKRKTIYTDISALNEYGMKIYEFDEIIEYDKKELGYRIVERIMYP